MRKPTSKSMTKANYSKESHKKLSTEAKPFKGKKINFNALDGSFSYGEHRPRV